MITCKQRIPLTYHAVPDSRTMRISLKFLFALLSTCCAAAASYASMMSLPADFNSRLLRAIFHAGLIFFVGVVWHLYYLSLRPADSKK